MNDEQPGRPTVDERIERLERRLVRERSAREQAERIAERGMRDLWTTNQDLEARVAARTAELQRSLAAAHLAADAKERFLAELGHELTTPLHAVLGLLELIEPTPLDADDQTRLDQVRLHASTLADLLNALVELAAADGASAPHDLTDRMPGRWLDDVVDRWTHRAAARGKLITPSVTDASQSVRTDWSRLGHIADVLLANAVQHAVPGAVRLDLVVAEASVMLAVHDEGPGMTAAEIDTAIEPFITHAAGGGVGIGLSIVHRLATSGGGSMELHGHDGTRAAVHLPRVG